jgi:hypothetical protein
MKSLYSARYRRILRPVIASATLLLLGAGALGAAMVAGGKYRVKAHALNKHEFTYTASEDIAPTVNGDGDTDLDCYLIRYDERLEFWIRVAEDVDDTDLCILKAPSRKAGRYAVVVDNALGKVYNDYELSR